MSTAIAAMRAELPQIHLSPRQVGALHIHIIGHHIDPIGDALLLLLGTKRTSRALEGGKNPEFPLHYDLALLVFPRGASIHLRLPRLPRSPLLVTLTRITLKMRAMP